MGNKEYSYQHNKKEIQKWLSNVKALKFRSEVRGEMGLDEVQKKLETLPKEASAFLTIDGDTLCIMVYTGRDQASPVETWKFRK